LKVNFILIHTGPSVLPAEVENSNVTFHDSKTSILMMVEWFICYSEVRIWLC